MFKLKGSTTVKLPAPLGYEKTSVVVAKGPVSSSVLTEANRVATANKQMMSIAWSPAKNIFTNAKRLKRFTYPPSAQFHARRL